MTPRTDGPKRTAQHPDQSRLTYPKTTYHPAHGDLYLGLVSAKFLSLGFRPLTQALGRPHYVLVQLFVREAHQRARWYSGGGGEGRQPRNEELRLRELKPAPSSSGSFVSRAGVLLEGQMARRLRYLCRHRRSVVRLALRLARKRGDPLAHPHPPPQQNEATG